MATFRIVGAGADSLPMAGTPTPLPQGAAASPLILSSFSTRRKREGREGPLRGIAMLDDRDLTERIIGLAIEVHRQTGPALLKSIYAACMGFELEQAGIPLLHQVGIWVCYRACRYRWASAPT
jgi:hypothetical protein